MHTCVSKPTLHSYFINDWPANTIVTNGVHLLPLRKYWGNPSPRWYYLMTSTIVGDIRQITSKYFLLNILFFDMDALLAGVAVKEVCCQMHHIVLCYHKTNKVSRNLILLSSSLISLCMYASIVQSNFFHTVVNQITQYKSHRLSS